MALNQAFLTSLREMFHPSQLLTDTADCWLYSYDNSRHRAVAEAVFFAKTTQDVQTLIKQCRQYHVPLTVRGRGTGTPGGAVPLQGGVVLSLDKMDRILLLDPQNRLMKVEAGIVTQTVQNAAYEKGFFWAPDPGSSAYCAVGGNIGYNAAGPRAVKYGATRDNVLGLTAVTGAGDIIHTGGYTTKSAVGYDLTRLLIGSEGTLAIVTEAILKLHALPQKKYAFRALYKNISAAIAVVIAIMSQPYLPSALEFLDKHALKLLGFDSGGAMLLIEIDEENAKKNILAACQHEELIDIHIAKSDKAREKLWKARRELSSALRMLSPYKINEDVIVPVTALPELLKTLDELSQKYDIPIVNFGHAGNGNIHVNLLAKEAPECLQEIFEAVIALRGTLSGEHGIGLEKKPFMPFALDQSAIAIMRGIKNVFDPDNILNPGKLF
jgi:D-lactate dehydrogenase